MNQKSLPELSKQKLIAIGSCRVHAPIQVIAEDHNSNYYISNYYTHTSKEALKQLDLLLNPNYTPIKQDLIQYICNSEKKLQRCKKYALSNINNSKFIIEISSSKLLKFNGEYLQFNYFANNFLQKYTNHKSENLIQDWWRELTRNQLTSDKIQYYLENINFIDNLDKDIVANLEYTLQSKEDLRQDLITLTNLIPKEQLLIVTHIYTDTLQKQLASRLKFINTIQDLCAELNISICNPSDILINHAVENILDKNGTDTTHYNPDQYSFIGDFIYKHFNTANSLKRIQQPKQLKEQKYIIASGTSRLYSALKRLDNLQVYTEYNTYTSKEAIQQLNFIHNTKSLPTNNLIQQYITGKELYSPNTSVLLSEVNTIILEVSSMGIIKYQEYYLSSNAFKKYCLDKYNLNNWWTEYTKTNILNNQYLETNNSEILDILNNIQYTVINLREVLNDIQTIQAQFPNIKITLCGLKDINQSANTKKRYEFLQEQQSKYNYSFCLGEQELLDTLQTL